MLGEIEAKFNQSLVNPGEMCGILSSQLISEPAMQMTSNTFHYAGVSSPAHPPLPPFPKNITLGVPHLKEIINAATNIKMLSLSVYLEPDIAEDKMMVNNMQQELVFMSLHTVTAAVEIWYDPDLTTPPSPPP